MVQDVEYEVHSGYLGKIASALVVRKLVKDNILQSMESLKGIAELEEAPPPHKA